MHRDRIHGTPGPRWFPPGSPITRVHGDASMYVLHHYFLPIIRGLKNAPEANNVDIFYRMPSATGKTFQMGEVIKMGTKGQGRSIDALQFLMTREITHMKAFMAALESLGMGPLEIGKRPPSKGLVDQYFNDSTGSDELGGKDSLGPWNDGGSWRRVDAPAFQELADKKSGARESKEMGSFEPHAESPRSKK